MHSLPPLPTARAAVLAGACALVTVTAGNPALGDTTGIGWEPRIEVASGDARRGPWRMNESEFHYVDDPSVDIDSAGRIAVVWADQAEQDIYFQRYEPDGRPRFDVPVNISGSGEIFSWLPRVIMAGDEGQEIYVLWQEIIFSGGSHGGEILFARSDDGGRSFSRPLNLSRTPAGAGKGRLTRQHWHNGSLDLARAPGGTLYAAWTEYEGALRFSRSTDNGESFSEPLQIAGGGNEPPGRGPTLAVAADGTIYLAWTVGEDASADIHLAASTDGGRSFGEHQVVAPGAGHADAPKLAVDHACLHLAYAEGPAGPMHGYRIRYARACGLDARPSFEAPRTVAEDNDVAGAAFPALALDGEGAVYLSWERFPERGARSRGLGYALSTDGGDSFTASAVVPGSDDEALGFNGSQQGLLMKKLAASGNRHVAVVNSTYASGEASYIWLHRGRRQ